MAPDDKHRKTLLIARKPDGNRGVKLLAASPSWRPEGFARRTLRLLRENLVEPQRIESIFRETIRKTLQGPSDRQAHHDRHTDRVGEAVPRIKVG